MSTNRIPRGFRLPTITLVLLSVGVPLTAAESPYPSVVIAGVAVEIGADKTVLLGQLGEKKARVSVSEEPGSGLELAAVWPPGKEEMEGVLTFAGGRLVAFQRSWSSFEDGDSAPALAQSFIGLIAAYCQVSHSEVSVRTYRLPQHSFEAVEFHQDGTTCSLELVTATSGERWVNLEVRASTLDKD